MCFSLVDPISFSNIIENWHPEIREYYKDVPILLVGTKADLKCEMKDKMKSQKLFKQSTISLKEADLNSTINLFNEPWNLKKKVNFFNKNISSKQKILFLLKKKNFTVSICDV